MPSSAIARTALLVAPALVASACEGPFVVVSVGEEGAAGAGAGTSSPGVCEALAAPAFCDAFDTAAPGGRGGDLDEARWSVARITSGLNVGQSNLADWGPATASACGEDRPGLLPAADAFFCTHPVTGETQLNDVFDDAGTSAFHAFRVRQRIDFEDRTATIAIRLDAKQANPGGSGYWWALAIAEEPAPGPYLAHFSHLTSPKRALLFDFNGFDCTGGDGTQNQVSGVYVWDDYVLVQELRYEDILDNQCFGVADEVLNRVEIRFSRDDAEVWASDLDDDTTFRRVARVEGLELPFTRGFVSWLHVQNNSSASAVTYHLGSLAFDGPILPLPRAYDLPLAMTPPGNSPADHVNVGYLLGPDPYLQTCCDPATLDGFTIEGVDLEGSTSARLNLNAADFGTGEVISYRFNGGAWQDFAHPFPDEDVGARALTMPVELDSLVAGTNLLELRASADVLMLNGELELARD